MDDEDFGNDRDPLLVRPFVVQDGDVPEEHASSGATWPAGAASDSATQVLPVFSSGRAARVRSARRKRRPVLLLVAGAGVVTMLAAAGYTALGPSFEPALSADLPEHSLPAVIGPGAASTPARTGAAGGDDSGTGSHSGQGTGAAVKISPTGARTTAPSKPAGSAAAGGAASAKPKSPALAPSPATTGIGALVSGDRLCLDVPDAIPVDENNIQVFDCNRSIAQVWTLAQDGTLRAMGRCALVAGDGTVHLADCDQRTTAQWHVTGDRELINAATSGCLTDPSGGGRAGTRVLVVKCTGDSNQSWSLR